MGGKQGIKVNAERERQRFTREFTRRRGLGLHLIVQHGSG